MSEIEYCPTCDTVSGYRIEQRNETHEIRGDAVVVQAEIAICRNCGAEVGVPELDERTLDRAYDAYRQLHRIPGPEQIRSLRERWQLSQRGFARLLGWAQPTMSRYEMGSLPDQPHADLIDMLQNDTTFRRFAGEHMARLHELDKRKLTKALNERRPESVPMLVQNSLIEMMNFFGPNERGQRDFDLDRLGHMAVFLCRSEYPPKTKLLKMMWYGDAHAYQQTACSLSGTVYVHAQYGPAPLEHELVLAELVALDFIDAVQTMYELANGEVREGTEYRAAVEFDRSLFSEVEIAMLEDVHLRLAGLSALQTVNITHTEDAYRMTEDGQVISYSRIESLNAFRKVRRQTAFSFSDQTQT